MSTGTTTCLLPPQGFADQHRFGEEPEVALTEIRTVWDQQEAEDEGREGGPIGGHKEETQKKSDEMGLLRHRGDSHTPGLHEP